MTEREDNHFRAVMVGGIGGQPIQTVNARDLHAFLKVGKGLSTWIKDRIEAYGAGSQQPHAVPGSRQAMQG